MHIYSTEDFIAKLTPVQINQYDYSLSVYKGSTIYLTIICKLHGPFLIKPKNHFKGQGCKKCGYKKLSRTNSHNTEQFITKSLKRYPSKIDSYKDTIYVNSSTKITVHCKFHGPFEITPNNYLSGRRCSECRSENLSAKYKKDTRFFIKKATQVFGTKYDYSSTTYSNAKTKVTIICKTHGIFSQLPGNHLYGFEGCIKCEPKSLGEKLISGFLEKINIQYKQQYRFTDCRYKNALVFDFAIFIDGDLLGLIEFQGEQHYKITKWSRKTTNKMASDSLMSLQERDKIKKEYCERNSIPLLIIPHWHKDKIKVLISEFISKLPHSH